MLSCEVISGLMAAYASAEASAETCRLVEEHLGQCQACREAFREGGLAETALAGLEPPGEPSRGPHFITRTRRLLFAIGAGVLLLFACVLAGIQRWVVHEVAGIPVPHLPGPPPLWLAAGVAALALYLVALLAGRRAIGWGIVASLLAAIPLLIVAVVAYQLTSAGTVPAGLAGLLLLLAALATTYARLPRLLYMTLATVLVLGLVNGLLLAQTAAGVLALSDLSFESATSLGQPAPGAALEDAVRLDLRSLGLGWQRTRQITEVARQPIGRQARAVQAAYEGDGQQALLTVARFGSREAAAAFFAAWSDDVSSGVQLMRMDLQLPGDSGSIFRTYDIRTQRAYSAWQAGSWVTIIEVPGPFARAAPLARDIKRIAAESYRNVQLE